MKTFFLSQIAGWRKSEGLWLLFCLSAVSFLSAAVGETFLGFLAALSGMLYTLLAGKGKRACFLFGLVNTPLYALLSFRQGYYGDAALNVYYFAMMVPGFLAWRRHAATSAEEGVVRTRLARRDALLLGAVLTGVTLLLWALLSVSGGSRPFCDALTTVCSVAAMWLTVRRAIEQWVLWSLVNAVEGVMWWTVWAKTGEGAAILLMWLLFLANGLVLLAQWVRLARRHPLRVSRLRLRV